MFDDVIKINNNEDMFEFVISKKVIDELYAMHGIIAGVSEMIEYEIKEYINNNLKEDKDYYNKIGKKIIEKYMEEKNEET